MHPAPPLPTRYSALMYLAGRADFTASSFFTPNNQQKDLVWNFEGLTLGVKKRTLSMADPANVTYEIYLGQLLRRGAVLLACVLRPKEDVEANRAAFKRCLEELANKPAFEMSQHNA